MGIYKNKTYPLRLDNTKMEKLRKIAEENYRPLSKQIEIAIDEYLTKYEQKKDTEKQ